MDRRDDDRDLAAGRRLLDHQRWLERFRSDAETLENEELGTEPGAWWSAARSTASTSRPRTACLAVVTVISTSTPARPAVLRPEVEIAGWSTRLLVDQVRSIDTAYVVGDPVDVLNPDVLNPDVLNTDELAESSSHSRTTSGVQEVGSPV